MAKPNKKTKKPQKEITLKLNKPMSLDEIAREMGKVRPPTDEQPPKIT